MTPPEHTLVARRGESRNAPHTCPYCDAPRADVIAYGPLRTFICGTRALIQWHGLGAQLFHEHRAKGTDLDDFGDQRSDMCQWVTKRIGAAA